MTEPAVPGTEPQVDAVATSPRDRSPWSFRAVDLVPAAVFLAFQAWAAVAFASLPGSTMSPRLLWDATAYLRIAEHGYATGGSAGNPPQGYADYAYHPLYPLLTRLVGEATTLGPAVVAPWLSLFAAVAALVVLSVWLRPLVGVPGVLGATLLLSAAPASPVFQMGYTEGLALLLVVASWALVDRRHYAGAAATVTLLALTRPVVAPLLLAVLWHAWVCWRETRSPRTVLAPLGVVAVGGVALLVWPALAGALSGDPTVYWSAHTEFARPDVPLSTASLGLAHPWFGGLLLAVLALPVLVATRLLPHGTPPVVTAWSAVYLPYVSVAALVTPSLLRYALLAFPLGTALAPLLRHRVAGPVVVVAVVAVGLRTQWWWVHEFVPLGGDSTYP